MRLATLKPHRPTTPANSKEWKRLGSRAMRKRRCTMITSPGHIPSQRGHRDRRDWQVTAQAAPGWAGPCAGTGPGGARVRPERPMGGAGAKRKKSAEGLRKRQLNSCDNAGIQLKERATRLQVRE